jgi:hypothetical protein
MYFRRFLTVAALVAGTLAGGASAQAKPETEVAYAQGKTVTIAAMRFITSPSPAQLAAADDLYLATYPIDANETGSAPQTLASGYQPNCNPCWHPGLTSNLVYHDHVLSGAPRLGRSSSPRHLIIVQYASSVMTDPLFQPLKSVDAVKAGETQGMFQAIGSGSNPYEIDTGIIVVTAPVSPKA